MTNTCKACGRPIPTDQHICLQCGTENVMQTFEQRKKNPKTNGDRIRAMTDEQLIPVVMHFVCIQYPECCPCSECTECVRQWLNEEVQNG